MEVMLPYDALQYCAKQLEGVRPDKCLGKTGTIDGLIWQIDRLMNENIPFGIIYYASPAEDSPIENVNMLLVDFREANKE